MAVSGRFDCSFEEVVLGQKRKCLCGNTKCSMGIFISRPLIGWQHDRRVNREYFIQQDLALFLPSPEMPRTVINKQHFL